MPMVSHVLPSRCSELIVVYDVHYYLRFYIIEILPKREKRREGTSEHCVRWFLQSQFRLVLGDGDALAQVDILDGVQQLDALRHRLLERFATADHATAAGALVDHGRGDSFDQVVVA
ncbi:hypothetical protein BH10CYA1_BH10CYA1_32010 [soil metagenome]